VILYFAFLAQFVLMLGVPPAAAWIAQRRFRGSWWLVAAGALAFIGSQVVHIPMLVGIGLLVKWLGPIPAAYKLAFDCAIGGLGAGLCEEWARWVVLAKWRREARDAPSAVLLGLGHGGVEAMILGALVVLAFANMTVMRMTDPAELGVPAEQLETVRTQVAQFWSTPAYMPILAGAERLMAMTLHVTNNLLVMLAVVRGQHRYVWLAVSWHAIGNALVVAVASLVGPAEAEGALFVFTLGSIALSIVTWRTLRRGEPGKLGAT
jgi:uncharacterized membrane protein YhfC